MSTTDTIPMPLTVEQIKAERSKGTLTLQEATSRLRAIRRLTVASTIFATLLMGYLYMYGYLNSSHLGLIVIAFVVALFGFVLVSPGAFSSAVGSSALAVMVTEWIWLRGGVPEYPSGVPEYPSLELWWLLCCVFITALAIAVLMAFAVNSAASKQSIATFHLADLGDLDQNASGFCVQYLAWCEHEPALAAYQDQIGKMNRMPIMLGYLTAKEWIDGAVARRLAEKSATAAQEARKKLSDWGQPVSA